MADSILAMSLNLGCGGPHPAATRDAAFAWGTSVRGADPGPDLVFVQEHPGAEWISGWLTEGWAAFETAEPAYRCRSAVLVRAPLAASVREYAVPTAAYHGTYVAACELALNGHAVRLLSIHASPTDVGANWDRMYAQSWGGSGAVPPRFRDDGSRWDSDCVLTTIGICAATAPVIAAGDVNEARRWNADRAIEGDGVFFDRLAELNITDCIGGSLSEEVASQHPGRGRGYQVDRLLTQHVPASCISDARVVGPELAHPLHGGSDHSPLEFRISLRPEHWAAPTA